MKTLKKILKYVKKNIFRILALVFIIVVTIIMIVFIPKLNDRERKLREEKNNSNASSLIPLPDTITPVDTKKKLEDIETIGSYMRPTIPKGFKSVDTDTAKWESDENGNITDWNKGLVIEDSIGNEFVWIPVEDILSFTKKEGYSEGEIQDYLEHIKEGDYSGDLAFVESEKLYESIKKYQGFYIARYEAGVSSIDEDIEYDGSIKPISKNGAYTLSNVPWGASTGRALDGELGTDTSSGAVKMARSMYPDMENIDTYKLPKDITNETGAISTLVYGIEWDLVMDFLSDITNERNGEKFVVNSSGMGKYEDQDTYLTGSYSTKNIYDIAGNVAEWTMECYTDEYRIARGGAASIGVAKAPSASMRTFSPPGKSSYGFRVALFISQ